jgi:hypothetical protein
MEAIKTPGPPASKVDMCFIVVHIARKELLD